MFTGVVKIILLAVPTSLEESSYKQSSILSHLYDNFRYRLPRNSFQFAPTTSSLVEFLSRIVIQLSNLGPMMAVGG